MTEICDVAVSGAGTAGLVSGRARGATCVVQSRPVRRAADAGRTNLPGADDQPARAESDARRRLRTRRGAVRGDPPVRRHLRVRRDGVGGAQARRRLARDRCRVRRPPARGNRIVTARAVILAGGALERPFPIPGWTLPGVMAAGAAQLLLKASGIVAEGRVVLAGTGPLLWLLASQYLRAGVKPDAVLETPSGADAGWRCGGVEFRPLALLPARGRHDPRCAPPRPRRLPRDGARGERSVPAGNRQLSRRWRNARAARRPPAAAPGRRPGHQPRKRDRMRLPLERSAGVLRARR